MFDTHAHLAALQVQLAEGQEAAGQYGGARHATAVLSSRSLLVVRRKSHLLGEVEARTARFAAAQARCDELLPEVVAGPSRSVADLAGVRKFIIYYTHPHCNPVDDNMSDFQNFAASFKLPAGHQALLHLRAIADEAGNWWADACVQEASRGADHATLNRLIEVALGTGIDAEHYKVLRARQILIDRLADRTLKEAKEAQQADTLNAERLGDRMPVGPASKAADLIESMMIQVVKEGVPKFDRRLVEAERILKQLREADGARKRTAGRLKRLEEKARKASEAADKAGAGSSGESRSSLVTR
jgi:hypothetical protein